MKLYDIEYAPNDWTSDRHSVLVVAEDIVKASIRALKGRSRYSKPYVTKAVEIFSNVIVER